MGPQAITTLGQPLQPPPLVRLCTGTLAKALFLLLVLGMLLYCFQEQMNINVFAINGHLARNSTKSPFTGQDFYEDILPSPLDNSSYLKQVPGISDPLVLNVTVDSPNKNVTDTTLADSQQNVTLTTVSDEASSTSTNASVEADVDEGVSSNTCVFPHINPFDPNIMKMAGLDHKPLVCKTSMPDLTYLQQSSLYINKSLAEEKYGISQVHCKYQNILRKNNEDNSLHFSDFSAPFTDSLQLPEDVEYIFVICEGDLNAKDSNSTTTPPSAKQLTTLSRTYYPLIPLLKKFSDVESLLLKKRLAETSPKETMNIVMIGFDGVPRHQFLRAMNRTYAFLMKDLNSFDMSMYTQVGLNTFPNFMALLGGRLEDEVYSWWDFKKYTDGFDLVWKDLHKAGYRTLYTEDAPSIGAFHYQKIGFLNTPTVYFSRPISLAIERDKETCNGGDQCVGNQPEVSFHFDYIKRFLQTFPDKPLYAMSFHTKLTHDDMTRLKMADDHVYDFYNDLHTSGLLNNTLLITFSDHGQRWGSIRSTFNGVIESRTPYAIFTFPTWFLEKYPDAARNLKANTGRLTTHFDTHATIQDLLYFHASGDIPLRKSNHGISLFRKIPKNRTCADIPIPPDFCVCGQQSMNAVDTNSSISKLLSEKVTESINKKRDSKLCQELKLDKILEVLFVKFPDNILKEKLDKSLFKVRIQTKPGLAIYEATVNAVVNDQSIVGSVMDWLGLETRKLSNIDVGDSIDRLNMYRGQADCVADARQKPFCYCNDLPDR